MTSTTTRLNSFHIIINNNNYCHLLSLTQNNNNNSSNNNKKYHSNTLSSYFVQFLCSQFEFSTSVVSRNNRVRYRMSLQKSIVPWNVTCVCTYCTISTVFQENTKNTGTILWCVSVKYHLYTYTCFLSFFFEYRFCETTTATMVQSTKEGKERGSIAAASSLSCIIVLISWQQRNIKSTISVWLCLSLHHEPDPYTVMIGPFMHNIDHTVYSRNLDHSMMLLLLQ